MSGPWGQRYHKVVCRSITASNFEKAGNDFWDTRYCFVFNSRSIKEFGELKVCVRGTALDTRRHMLQMRPDEKVALGHTLKQGQKFPRHVHGSRWKEFLHIFGTGTQDELSSRYAALQQETWVSQWVQHTGVRAVWLKFSCFVLILICYLEELFAQVHIYIYAHMREVWVGGVTFGSSFGRLLVWNLSLVCDMSCVLEMIMSLILVLLYSQDSWSCWFFQCNFVVSSDMVEMLVLLLISGFWVI